MSTNPTVTRSIQQMSENTTSFKHLLQVLTKARAKSSSQQVRPITEMVDAIEKLAKRKKGQGSDPTTTLTSISTTDGEVTATSPTSNPIPTNGSESAALQVWNELFEEDEIRKITEQSNYIQVKVARLLKAGQMERMTIGIMEELKKKKEPFSRLRGYDTKTL